MVNLVLPLRGLNEMNGAITCDDAEKAGVKLSDRVIKVVSERQAES